MAIVGPVKKHLDGLERAGWKGWSVEISKLRETIKAYEGDPDAPDYVVFSTRGRDFYILGPTEEEVGDSLKVAQSKDEPGILASTQPKDPGEIDQFPPWPPG
jgi:hypothetical protein